MLTVTVLLVNSCYYYHSISPPLLADVPYPSHFTFKQAVSCALDLRAKCTIFTGMNHSISYHAEDPKLRAFSAEYGLDIQCGYDGLAKQITLGRICSIEEVRSEVDAARASWKTLAVPLGESIAPEMTGPAVIPNYRYDTRPDVSAWEPGQSPSPQWKRPPV